MTDVVRNARFVIFDFDGPMTPFMPSPLGRQAADAARAGIPEGAATLPPEVVETADHLAVLRWAAYDHDVLELVERTSTEFEMHCARHSIPVPETLDFIRKCPTPLYVASNNATVAVEEFLRRHEMLDCFAAIVGRPWCRPDLMKPHPHELLECISAAGLPAEQGVFIGNNQTDIDAGTAAGMPVIGLSPNPERRQSFVGAAAVKATCEGLL